MNIRGIDEGLVRMAKGRAAAEGISLRDWLVAAIAAALKEGGNGNTGARVRVQGEDLGRGAAVRGGTEKPGREDTAHTGRAHAESAAVDGGVQKDTGVRESPDGAGWRQGSVKGPEGYLVCVKHGERYCTVCPGGQDGRRA